LLWDQNFWEIKEYRWDRFWTDLRWDQGSTGRNYLMISVKFILFSITTLIFTIPYFAVFGILSAFTIWTFQGIDFLKDILGNDFRKPSIKSPRNILIIALAFFTFTVLVALISYPFVVIHRDLANGDSIGTTDFVNSIFQRNVENKIFIIPDVVVLLAFSTLLGLFLDLAMPVIVPVFVFLTSPIATIRRNLIINKAKQKLNSLPKRPIFIGITGSQGKTSTKEILYSILSTKYKVAKTPENYNTTVGIASGILTSVKKDTEIFIAEIGAYKKGEINHAVRTFPLDTAIITDIAMQHVGLFGSPKKVAEAKFEITDYLDNNALAVISADNEFSVDLAEKLDSKVILTTTDSKKYDEIKKRDDLKTDVYFADEIKVNESTVSFKFRDEDKESVDVMMKSPKKHLADLGLICYVVAKHHGMTNDEILKAFESIKFPANRLEFETGDNNLNILNDSYNSNPKGFIAAVNLLDESAGRKKKVLVTKGIFELGKYKRKVYWDLALEMKSKVDLVITTDYLLKKVIEEAAPKIQVLKVVGADDMIYQIRTNTEPGDYVLIEGRVAPKVIKSMISDRM
jgi:UDP-N-acetylmuramoyl-tripeptide--D-alanyl-D-alanine ligase